MRDDHLLPLYKIRPLIRLCTEVAAEVNYQMTEHLIHLTLSV